jgi:opacity protein-like surface antigen
MTTRALLITTISAFASVLPAVVSAQTAPGSIYYPNSLYFRADLGWSGGTGADIHDRIDNNLTVNPLSAIVGSGGHAGTLNDIGDGWFGGVGAGMQFTPNFRGDIVYTWRGDYRFDALDEANTRFKSDIHSNSVMVSGYFDYPMNGVVPYLGFGLGWSDVQMGNLSATSSLAINPLVMVSPHIVNSATTTIAVAPGGSSDNFAWQIMVGAGIPVSPGVVFDVFYRYFDGGTMRTAAGTVLINNTAVGTFAGVDGSLKANELGVSIRFALE